MPMLSCAVDGDLSEDHTFYPVTKLHGHDIPRYGLFFDVPDDYRAADFAFDNCKDFDQLIRTKVDPNFLISRYERLFEFQSGTEQVPTPTGLYYLVPWMAIPYTLMSGPTPPVKKTFALEVTSTSIYKVPPPTPSITNKSRMLELMSSSPATIKATWGQTQQATITRDITQLQEKITVTVTIPTVKYSEVGEVIWLEDVTDNQKIVGKMRIVFLQNITQDALLIDIEPVEQPVKGFRFKLRDTGDMPESLEADGSYHHGKLVDDANKFGYASIGVTISIKNDSINLFNAAGSMLLGHVNGNPIDHLVTRSTPLSAEDQYKEPPMSTQAQYRKLCEYFLSEIAHTKTGNNKENSYRLLYLFRAPFVFTAETDPNKNVPGISYSPDLKWSRTTIPEPNGGTRDGTTRANINLRALGLPNVNLWATVVNSHEEYEFNNRYSAYDTLVHESAHALFVKHFFDDAYDIPPLYKASRWLRLYVGNKFIPDDKIFETYDTEKIRIEHFATGTSAAEPTETQFDKIIDKGMAKALDEFVNSLFPQPPDSWTTVPANQMPMADLILWISLNDLVKFNLRTTANIMDYVKSRELKGHGNNNEAYYSPLPVRFTRFQWELLRKTISHLNSLTFK